LGESVHEREGFSTREKEMMLMPRETHLGITVTGIAVFVF